MLRFSTRFLSTFVLAGAVCAAAGCTTTVNNTTSGGTNTGTDTTGGGGGTDTTGGGGGGATCPIADEKQICCYGESAATGKLYKCADADAFGKCSVGSPDLDCQQACMNDPDPGACVAKCAPKMDPSGCTEVSASEAEKAVCCGGGGGGGGGGGDTTGGGGTDTGGGGGVTGLDWTGTWSVKLEYDVKCEQGLTSPWVGHQSFTKSVSISGSNTDLQLSTDGGNHTMMGTGHDDHAQFNGDFPFVDAKGGLAGGQAKDTQGSFNITTVVTKDKVTGDIEGTKFPDQYSNTPKCTVSNSTLVMTR